MADLAIGGMVIWAVTLISVFSEEAGTLANDTQLEEHSRNSVLYLFDYRAYSLKFYYALYLAVEKWKINACQYSLCSFSM